MYKIMNDYKVRFAEESDTKKLVTFINDAGINNNFKNYSKSIFVNKLELKSNNFKELNIRYNLYNYFEEFILLEKEEKINSLISFQINKASLSKAYVLSAVVLNDNMDDLKGMINFAIENLPEYGIITPTKIRAIIDNSDSRYDYWYEILQDIGFEKELVRKNELGCGRAITSMVVNI